MCKRCEKLYREADCIRAELASVPCNYTPRTKYYREYYQANAERKRVSALARYYERKPDETYMEARRERERIRRQEIKL